MDHGVGAVSKVTPSMTLIHDPPGTLNGSWYRGQLLCCLKDALTQPSTAMRHATEICTAVEKHVDQRMGKESASFNGAFPQIIIIGSDGGGDHNTTFMSVMMAHLATFVKTDADMVLARRAAPHNSYTQVLERCMTIGFAKTSLGQTSFDHLIWHCAGGGGGGQWQQQQQQQIEPMVEEQDQQPHISTPAHTSVPTLVHAGGAAQGAHPQQQPNGLSCPCHNILAPISFT